MSSPGQQPSRHEMILEQTQPSGVDLWSCPECGRRFAMRWLPDYERVVLEPGDEHVVHVGGTGGVRIAKVEVIAGVDAEAEQAKWLRWLDNHGIQWEGPAA